MAKAVGLIFLLLNVKRYLYNYLVDNWIHIFTEQEKGHECTNDLIIQNITTDNNSHAVTFKFTIFSYERF